MLFCSKLQVLKAKPEADDPHCGGGSVSSALLCSLGSPRDSSLPGGQSALQTKSCFLCGRRRPCRCSFMPLEKRTEDVDALVTTTPQEKRRSGLVVMDMNSSAKVTYDPFGDCLGPDDCCADRGKPSGTMHQEHPRYRPERLMICFNFLQIPITSLELQNYFDTFGDVEELHILEGGMNGIVTFHDANAARMVLEISKHIIQPGKSIIVAPCSQSAQNENLPENGLPIDFGGGSSGMMMPVLTDSTYPAPTGVTKARRVKAPHNNA